MACVVFWIYPRDLKTLLVEHRSDTFLPTAFADCRSRIFDVLAESTASLNVSTSREIDACSPHAPHSRLRVRDKRIEEAALNSTEGGAE